MRPLPLPGMFSLMREHLIRLVGISISIGTAGTAQDTNKKPRKNKSWGGTSPRWNFLALGAAGGQDFLSNRRSRKDIKKSRSGSSPKGENKPSPGGGLEKAIS